MTSDSSRPLISTGMPLPGTSRLSTCFFFDLEISKDEGPLFIQHIVLTGEMAVKKNAVTKSTVNYGETIVAIPGFRRIKGCWDFVHRPVGNCLCLQ